MLMMISCIVTNVSECERKMYFINYFFFPSKLKNEKIKNFNRKKLSEKKGFIRPAE